MNKDLMSIDLAIKLKALRKEKGLSHQRLSEELSNRYGLEISKQSLMNYEVADEYHSKFGSNKTMNLDFLRCLADFYGVSFDYLLTPRNEVRNPDQAVQAIGRYTQLSEKATEKLAFNHCERPELHEALDMLISSDGFEPLLNTIAEVSRAIKRARFSIKNAQESGLDSGNTRIALNLAQEEMERAVWKTTKAITDVCYEVFPVSEVEEELRSAVDKAAADEVTRSKRLKVKAKRATLYESIQDNADGLVHVAEEERHGD